MSYTRDELRALTADIMARRKAKRAIIAEVLTTMLGGKDPSEDLVYFVAESVPLFGGLDSEPNPWNVS